MVYRYSSTQFSPLGYRSPSLLLPRSDYPNYSRVVLVGKTPAGLMATFQGAFGNRQVSPDPLTYPKTSSSGHQQACWYYPGNHQDRMPQDR